MTKVTRKVSGPINSTIAGLPVDRKPPAGAWLTHWVIYQRPKDHPDGYVLRATYNIEGGGIVVDPVAWYAEDAESLRKLVPPDKVKLMRSTDDDPVILETWL